jgi:hypothetical protein
MAARERRRDPRRQDQVAALRGRHLVRARDATDTTFARAQYAGAVFQYFPGSRLMLGMEYVFGQRQDRDGQTAADNRLQTSMQVRF